MWRIKNLGGSGNRIADRVQVTDSGRQGLRAKVKLAGKPGSVVGSHSSGPCIAARLKPPTRKLGGTRQRLPIRCCSGWRLPCRPCCHARGALLPHLFTLTLGQSKGRYLFCGTFPEVAPAGHYPAPFLHGARTFLPSCDARPPDRLAFVHLTRLRNDFTQIQLPKLAMTIFAFAQ